MRHSSPRQPRGRRRGVAALAVGLVLTGGVASACGGSSSSTPTKAAAGSKVTTLRLGYFPNLTHASAIVGVNKGYFQKALGAKVKLDASKTFNAGPAAIEALFSGAIDATYIGPGPTINGFVQSKGDALRVISGATSGGAALVVNKSIKTVADLKGKNIATPQLGNTQDVALRYFLSTKGLKTTTTGAGDVSIKPQENSQTLDTFAAGTIDGAWVPEPYATRLVAEGAHVLVDERSLWPGGKFVVTNLIVSRKFLEAHPDAVKGLLRGQVMANDYINKNPAESQKIVNAALDKLTGKPLKPAVITTAWKSLTFTNDPLASTLRAGAQHAVKVGLIKSPDLAELYDLAPLNAALKTAGEPEVSAS